MNKSEPRSQADFADTPAGEGFTKFHGGGRYADAHDFEANPELTGQVLSMRSVKLRQGGRDNDTRVMTVGTDAGEATVWESAALGDFFDHCYTGCRVRMVFTGLIDLQNGQNPMKGFDLWLNAPEKT